MELHLPFVQPPTGSTFTLNLDHMDTSGSPPSGGVPRILHLSATDIHLFSTGPEDPPSPISLSPRGSTEVFMGKIRVFVQGGISFDCDAETLLQFPCTGLAISVREQMRRRCPGSTNPEIVLDGLNASTFELLLRYLNEYKKRHMSSFTPAESKQLLPAALLLGFQDLAELLQNKYLANDEEYLQSLRSSVGAVAPLPSLLLSQTQSLQMSSSPPRPNNFVYSPSPR